MTQLSSQQSAVSSQNQFFLVVQLPDGEEVEHSLLAREITIGRDPDNKICIPHAFVSQFHAKLVRYGDVLTLVDLGSVNKTRVNGRPVLQKSLTPGDKIEFAGVKSRLVQTSSPGPRAVAKSLDVVSSPANGGESASSKNEPHYQAPVSKLPLLTALLLLILLAAYLAAQVF